MSFPSRGSSESDDHVLLEIGEALSSEEAKELEHLCEQTPSDKKTRMKLIGHFMSARSNSPSLFKQIFWLIQEEPENLAWPQIALLVGGQKVPEELFENARKLWMTKAAEFQANAAVIGNAGLFLIQYDFQIGEKLLQKATNLDPKNDLWLEWLSKQQYLRARNAHSEERKLLASKALATGAQFLEQYGNLKGRKNSGLRIMALEWCAQTAYWSGDFIAAKVFAEDHIEITAHGRYSPKLSRSILGLLALEEKDVSTAKQHLLFMNKGTLIDKWDLKLASQLLKIGEPDVVIEYLRKCKKQQHLKHYDLDEWVEILTAGGELNLDELV